MTCPSTPGIGLSSKRFDIPGGFHRMVPIADQVSLENGRIEGAGATPDVPVEAGRALDVALRSRPALSINSSGKAG